MQCLAAPAALRKFEADRMVDYSVVPSCQAAIKPFRLGFHGLTEQRPDTEASRSFPKKKILFVARNPMTQARTNQSQSISA